MHQRAFVAGGWPRSGPSVVVRRAQPAPGGQFNVQVVRGKVNGKCLWNACKALSIGLLLMTLGSAMATIGYYADALSMGMEIRGNHTVQIKNESRGFHLNNLSYAGPIVMGVGGFIVVAACVMTFEARDSAAKVVPTRFKWMSPLPSPTHRGSHTVITRGSLRNSASQTTATTTLHMERDVAASQRRNIAHSFMQFSKAFPLRSIHGRYILSAPQQSLISKSPSAPDLSQGHITLPIVHASPCPEQYEHRERKTSDISPAKRLQRYTLSVDETAVSTYRCSNESLQDNSSHGSMTLDLHLDYPVTLRVHDKRRHPLQRQKPVDDDSHHRDDAKRSHSHSISPRPTHHSSRSHQLQQDILHSRRRSSNTSEYVHRSRSRLRDDSRQHRLERTSSSDSRYPTRHVRSQFLSQHNSQTSTEQPPPTMSCSDSDVCKVSTERK